MIKADASRRRGVPGRVGLLPETTNHAVRECVAVRYDTAFGTATPLVPKFISPGGPASCWTNVCVSRIFLDL
jgi:hypothetical protein